MKREFLMLAQKYDRIKHRHSNYYWSIKLDGMRAFWDGGMTRGQTVPWCSGTMTGLYSRYMKPIFAPDYWLDQLPHIPLDGELRIDPGKFQRVMSICRRHRPLPQWKEVKFMIIDQPGLDTVFDFGLFKSTHMTCLFDHVLRKYLKDLAKERFVPWEKSIPFNPSIGFPYDLSICPNVELVEQQRWTPEDEKEILNSILADGHEGIVLRRASSIWTPARTKDLLKIKPWNDSEGTVIGCTFGRETDKDSKLRGLMGALLISWNDKEFLLSGFTEHERTLIAEGGKTEQDKLENAHDYAYYHPGEKAPKDITPLHFPIGSQVTFKYRELSNDGVPKEARYWRKR